MLACSSMQCCNVAHAVYNIAALHAAALTSCRHNAHYRKTWRHPQNRKCISCYNAGRGRPSHNHRQHAQKHVKFGLVVPEICTRTDRQIETWETDSITDTLVTIPRTPSGWIHKYAYLYSLGLNLGSNISRAKSMGKNTRVIQCRVVSLKNVRSKRQYQNLRPWHGSWLSSQRPKPRCRGLEL